WEGVPARAAQQAAELAPVRPGDAALVASQDRLVEKQTLRSLGINTAPFAPVDDRAGLEAAVAQLGLPAVCKTRTGGYDGKGQVVLREKTDIDAAAALLASGPCILEGFIPFVRELSVLAVRSESGEFAAWPVVENEHIGGILHLSRAPAPGLDAALQARA